MASLLQTGDLSLYRRLVAGQVHRKLHHLVSNHASDRQNDAERQQDRS